MRDDISELMEGPELPQKRQRANDKPCVICQGITPPHLGMNLMLSCCHRPNCSQVQHWICRECYFNQFECFQLSENEPQGTLEFLIWLYHELCCNMQATSWWMDHLVVLLPSWNFAVSNQLKGIFCTFVLLPLSNARPFRVCFPSLWFNTHVFGTQAWLLAAHVFSFSAHWAFWSCWLQAQ